MPNIRIHNGLDIEYDTFGSPHDPALLLVQGYGGHMVNWRPGFCQRLADGDAQGGLYVIRYDNRDVGLSSKFHGRAVDLDAIRARMEAGDLAGARALAPYSLSDMASDGLGLLTALGIDRAHVMGSSLGGTIAQTMAIEHPERLFSMTSMMSMTGEPQYGQSAPHARAAMMAPTPPDRAGYIASSRDKGLVWGSKKYASPALLEQIAAESWDRCHYPEGAARQLAAAMSNGSRAEGLKRLTVPTLVIHGLDDCLITPSGGERTAALVPGAKLLMLEHMGHDRPEPLWPVMCDAVIAHVRQHGAARAG
jgi:pimeloyl-ACP methyl ester carboxylesterase